MSIIVIIIVVFMNGMTRHLCRHNELIIIYWRCWMVSW